MMFVQSRFKKQCLAAAVVFFATSFAWSAPAPDDVVKGYSQLVYANYTDALNAAKKMQTEIDAFLKTPSQAGLDAAKKAWLNAREFYGQTEAFRFYGGPIDDENGPEGRSTPGPWMNRMWIMYGATAAVVLSTM